MATSAKCCKLPPVSHVYEPKGRYETIAGLNTYIVGPENPTKGIIDIYDVFGLWPQTIQGADRLSASTGAVVLIPDFFYGEGLDKSLVPVDTEEKRAKLTEFITGKAEPTKNIAKLLEVRKAAGELFPSTGDRWGAFGLCWGGKIAVLASGAGNEGEGRRFCVTGQTHPGMLDAKDARALTCPHIVIVTPDEPEKEIAEYREVLSGSDKEGVVELYSSMFHGFMGARAKLEEEENVKEFQRGYEQVAEYFLQHL